MQRLRLALAVSIVAMSAEAAPASANDLGCQVLLCLSNPGGATQYPACVPPMVKLWERLALGGSFPGCSGGGVAKTKVYDRDSASRRRVVMTFTDGRQQSYSLANIESLPASLSERGTTPQ
ncbi:hypothetical protein HRJ34_28820 (plasmid) [Rhizorhabdus wittichii]|uniref:Uncharacterized protein n=1 Tax=Rhizorhabdus wittichii TaxID=160791 RepID=A0A975D922_9SPHN|nr:hypothetical protein [Rhizorhabdus wittichii]QTH24923.1 hypothetical protein HRJ34_28820 [Rhizorhabdus wittichii]